MGGIGDSDVEDEAPATAAERELGDKKRQRVVPELSGMDTSNGLGVAPAASSGMFPPAPPTSLSAEAKSIVDSLNASIGGDIRLVRTELVAVNNRLSAFEAKMAEQDARIQTLEQSLLTLQAELRASVRELREGGCGSTSAGSECGTSGRGGPYRSNGRENDLIDVTVVVGGFPYDSKKDSIEAILRDIKANYVNGDDITDFFCPGKRMSFGKLRFRDSEALWRFLRHFKGQKFQHLGALFWHSKEKTRDELQWSKRTSAALKVIRSHLEAQGVAKPEADRDLEADWNRGVIYFAADGGLTARIYNRDKSTGLMVVAEAAATSKLVLVHGFDPKAELERINGGQ